MLRVHPTPSARPSSPLVYLHARTLTGMYPSAPAPEGNMRAIATDDCKVRIRGRASAHFDILRNGVAREAREVGSIISVCGC